jgi:hypothetical protein
MAFVIEKDIAIPESTRPSARSSKYPLRDMEVGDSFFIPNVSTEEELKKARGAIASAAKTAKCKTTTRPMADEKTGVLGLRVWKAGLRDEAPVVEAPGAAAEEEEKPYDEQ